MAGIAFDVEYHFAAPAAELWWEMTDWPRHADWIPATRIELGADDASSVGGHFTAYTGFGPLVLVDRMRVAELEWKADEERGSCVVDKLGPVLRGHAGFGVEAVGPSTSRLVWFEDVDVPYLPGFLAPLVGRLARDGFRQGMSRLARTLESRQIPSES